MSDPQRTYLAMTGVAFVASFILSLVGNEWVQDLAWFGGHRTGEFGSRIDWLSMWGFMFTVTFLPLTFCFGGAFSLAVFKYPTIPSKVGKFIVLASVDAVFIYLISAAWDSRLGLAKDVLSCGIFGCYADDANSLSTATFDSNYRIAVGTCLFFPALSMAAYVFLLLSRLGIEPPAADAISGLSTLSRPSSAQHPSGGGRGTVMSGPEPISILGVGGRSSLHKDDAISVQSFRSSAAQSSLMREGLLSGDEDEEQRGAGNRRPLLSGAYRAREGRILPAPGPSGASLLLRPAALALGLFALLLATGWVPQNWELFTKNSLIDYAAVRGKDMVTEVAGSSMTTVHWTLAEGDKGKDDGGSGSGGGGDGALILHLFPDCLVFYTFLAFLVGVGALSRVHSGTERWLKARVLLVDDQPPPKWWWSWVGAPPWSVSRGGLVVLGAFAASLGCYLAYWDQMHSWHKGEKIEASAHAARVLGQLANFLMGVMLFPVTKNSILTSCFGIAWEQVIFVHIWLGQTVLLVVALHMLCWWRTYDHEGSFPEDILQVPMWFPTNSGCPADDRKCFLDFKSSTLADDDDKGKARTPDADNFTIQMATLASALMWICMGFFARYSVRRRNYELFHYLHHAFLVVFGTALLHAASSWYFLTGGLILWFSDRCLRALSRSRRWAVLSITPFPEGVTRLELAPLDDPLGRGAVPFYFSSGQYVYLNVPSVAPCEWHPFTISSAPSDHGAVTCHIKAAPGPLHSTFTGQLHLLAKHAEAKRKAGVVSLQQGPGGGGGGAGAVDAALRNPEGRGPFAAPGPPLVVSVDGPYGEFLDVDKHNELLLLAGGIGFTPVHSILRQIRSRMATGHCGCHRVHVMLAVQTRAALDPFLTTLQDVVGDSMDGRCLLSVFVDNEPGVPPVQLKPPQSGGSNADMLTPSSLQYKGVPFQVGRLNPVPAIKDLAHRQTMYSGHVFVCGPPGLAATADLACLQHGVSFHKEVFAF